MCVCVWGVTVILRGNRGRASRSRSHLASPKVYRTVCVDTKRKCQYDSEVHPSKIKVILKMTRFLYSKTGMEMKHTIKDRPA
jgi:hypothetical protein